MSFPGPPPPSRLAGLWRATAEAGLDALYPRLCWVCDSPLPLTAPRQGLDAWFCTACSETFERIEPPICNVCGEAYQGTMEAAFRCSNCEGRRFAFDFAVSKYKAHGPVRDLIHRFKYGREIALRGALAELLRGALDDARLQTENLASWLLVPVPLHRERETEREFNQSWELCRMLSRCTGIPGAQVLRRTRRTDSQARLDRRQRLQNMRGVFALRRSFPWRRVPDLHGRKILLVDDVLTTGATTHECAKVLKRQAGAEKVVVITAARG